MVNSMTGYSSQTGQAESCNWRWEIRSVNGRGLDIRIKTGGYGSVLETPIRDAIKKRLARGVVNVNFSCQKTNRGTAEVDADVLASLTASLREISESALAGGTTLAPYSAIDLLRMAREQNLSEPSDEAPEWVAQALEGFAKTLNAFIDMRQNEGSALAQLITDQLAEIEGIVGQAETAAIERDTSRKARFKTLISDLLDAGDLDPDRLEQEVALAAIKADIREEIDRLGAHITAAREILSGAGPHGRKLDFLVQEFMREANTLCSKSGDAELTRHGLALKTVIEQMREQVQNIE